MLSLSLYTMLKLSKTTSPQKLFVMNSISKYSETLQSSQRSRFVPCHCWTNYKYIESLMFCPKYFFYIYIWFFIASSIIFCFHCRFEPDLLSVLTSTEHEKIQILLRAAISHPFSQGRMLIVRTHCLKFGILELCIYGCLREATKKNLFLVVRPLRRGGG